MTKKKPYINTYLNSSEIRLHNKRVTINNDIPNEVTIHFQFLDESPETPACCHNVTHKGKVRYTMIKLSEEVLDALIHARTHYLEHKANNHE
jgi:hypothetical protein